LLAAVVDCPSHVGTRSPHVSETNQTQKGINQWGIYSYRVVSFDDGTEVGACL